MFGKGPEHAFSFSCLLLNPWNCLCLVYFRMRSVQLRNCFKVNCSQGTFGCDHVSVAFLLQTNAIIFYRPRDRGQVSLQVGVIMNSKQGGLALTSLPPISDHGQTVQPGVEWDVMGWVRQQLLLLQMSPSGSLGCTRFPFISLPHADRASDRSWGTLWILAEGPQSI